MVDEPFRQVVTDCGRFEFQSTSRRLLLAALALNHR